MRVFGATKFSTLLENSRSASPMNRAVNSASAKESRISGVHNCVDFLLSNVSDNDGEAAIKKLVFQFHLHTEFSLKPVLLLASRFNLYFFKHVLASQSLRNSLCLMFR